VTHVIVNDASCLIDVRKASLLHVMLALPHRFVVPYPVRASELLDFTPQEWRMLDDGGMITHELEADAVAEAIRMRARYPRLSARDCFCLVSTTHFENSLLLTGDRQLRRAGDEMRIRVHGVLWLFDQLAAGGIAPPDLLQSALSTWRDDPSVFLPLAELEVRLSNL
jgi:hypothetical protein